MYFALPEGWTSPVAASFRPSPLINAMSHGTEIDIEEREREQLIRYLSARHMTTVLMRSDYPLAPLWQTLLRAENAQIEETGGVILARLPASPP